MPRISISRLHVSTRLKVSFPAVLFIAWLAFIAWAVWRHVQLSQEPLLGDARSYWLKAHNFWHSFGEKSLFNPFDLDPTVRPPGTVLMSYPFGITESFKGFLFRSIYLGIALTAGAIYVAAHSIRSSVARRIDVPCVALFMCALPLFYHFEYGEGSPTYWGLVDVYLAGSAALAVSLAMLGAARASPTVTVLSALLSGLCFTVKPAGLLVILLTVVCWFSVRITVNIATASAGMQRKKFWPPFGAGITAFALIDGSLIYAGRHSKYFSSENLAFGNRALTFLREDWLSLTPRALAWNLHTSLSFMLIVALVIMLSAGLLHFRRRSGVVMNLSSAAAFAGWTTAILYLGIGAWFWTIYTGGSQVRFFYPFALSAAVCLVPLSLLILDRTNATLRTLIRFVLILPSLNIAILLVLTNPPSNWQRLSGVNISIHPKSPDVVLAGQLLSEIRERKQGAVIYEDMSRALVIESYWGYELVAHPELPNIRVMGPYNFVRPAAYRLEEIANSDFLLFPVVRDPSERARRLGVREVLNYPAEQEVFQAWFSTLDAEHGVAVFGETEEFRILRVVDHDRLETALQAFRSGRTWGNVFIEANPQSQLWSSEDEISARVRSGSAVWTDVEFGHVFGVEAVALRRNNTELQVEAWWTPIGEKMPCGEWFLFVHLIDEGGAILINTAVKLPSDLRSPSPRQFRSSIATVQVEPGVAPKAIAFGFYRSQGNRAETLQANKGRRDWEDHRVILPLQ